MPSLEQQQEIILFLDKLGDKIKNMNEYYNHGNLFKLLLDCNYYKFE